MLLLLRFFCQLLVALLPQQEVLGEYWGTGEEEAKYYKLVDLPLPKELAIEAGSFEVMPDKKQLAVATRRGDIFWRTEPLTSFLNPSSKNLPVG